MMHYVQAFFLGVFFVLMSFVLTIVSLSFWTLATYQFSYEPIFVAAVALAWGGLQGVFVGVINK